MKIPRFDVKEWVVSNMICNLGVEGWYVV